jgi:hypothetical protein
VVLLVKTAVSQLGRMCSGPPKPSFPVFTKICRDLCLFWQEILDARRIVRHESDSLPSLAQYALNKNREKQGNLLTAASSPIGGGNWEPGSFPPMSTAVSRQRKKRPSKTIPVRTARIGRALSGVGNPRKSSRPFK